MLLSNVVYWLFDKLGLYVLFEFIFININISI